MRFHDGPDLLRPAEGGMQSCLRQEQLEEDLAAGSGRQRDARLALEACVRTLNGARVQVTAAQNTISGYELRRNARAGKRDALSQDIRSITGELDGVSARARARLKIRFFFIVSPPFFCIFSSL